jgi:hypothetical protein
VLGQQKVSCAYFSWRTLSVTLVLVCQVYLSQRAFHKLENLPRVQDLEEQKHNQLGNAEAEAGLDPCGIGDLYARYLSPSGDGTHSPSFNGYDDAFTTPTKSFPSLQMPPPSNVQRCTMTTTMTASPSGVTSTTAAAGSLHTTMTTCQILALSRMRPQGTCSRIRTKPGLWISSRLAMFARSALRHQEIVNFLNAPYDVLTRKLRTIKINFTKTNRLQKRRSTLWICLIPLNQDRKGHQRGWNRPAQITHTHTQKDNKERSRSNEWKDEMSVGSQKAKKKQSITASM